MVKLLGKVLKGAIRNLVGPEAELLEAVVGLEGLGQGPAPPVANAIFIEAKAFNH